MKKKVFYMEWAYVCGIIFLALGTALMEKANFGMSMVVAPAYLLYLKLSETLPFVTFGMMEYTLQAVLLVVMMLVLRRFRISYLFSFVTAVIYGFTLDGCMLLVAPLPGEMIVVRGACYIVGMLVCSLGVAFMFHTYIAPEAYELLVKEVSGKYNIPIGKFKTGYDCASLLVSIVLSFAFFGLWHFEGVKLGTIICALINGSIIGWMSRWMDEKWDFIKGFRA